MVRGHGSQCCLPNGGDHHKECGTLLSHMHLSWSLTCELFLSLDLSVAYLTKSTGSRYVKRPSYSDLLLLGGNNRLPYSFFSTSGHVDVHVSWVFGMIFVGRGSLGVIQGFWV